MNKREAFAKLETLDRQAVLIGHVLAVLEWDFETSISPRGGTERGEQCAWLEGELHRLMTSPELGEALEALGDNPAGFSDRAKALVRVCGKASRDYRRVPADLVKAFAKATNAASNRWFESRKSNDFASYRPFLERVIELAKERAACISDGEKTPYDTLLDRYEPHMDSARIEALFCQMENTIHKIMSMTEGKSEDDSFLFGAYPVKTQERLGKAIVRSMGFDMQRGVIGLSHHPFTTSVGADDIRITSRFTDPKVTDSFFSYMHEGGHALYEMGASNRLTRGTSLAGGTSMAFHESQSRLWENIVGRSEAFWEHYYPRFQRAYGKRLDGVDLKRFARALNKVMPSDIRVNADEVTYGLHIILRFRLEKALFDGSLKAGDLPGAWDELSLSLLGRRPESDGNGVLQDNHWAGGMFGYFPSYALGNLINAQIYHSMKKELDVERLLKEGRLKVIKKYLDDKIYRHGAIYESDVLLEKITGERLDGKCFDLYLTEKFKKLYE